MRVVAITCVKNEADIVEAFVRHTLAAVDHLVVLDNGSADETRDILAALAGEGLPLAIVDDRSSGNFQWRRTTSLVREHALGRLDADWIVPLDVDEFLSGGDLKAILAEEGRDDRPLVIHWKNYVPDSSDDAGERNPALRIRHRLVREARTCPKVIVPARLGRAPGMTLEQGSHSVMIDGASIESATVDSVHLAHFPGRSPEQFARKVAVKHLQYRAMAERGAQWGQHYREAIELLRRDRRRFDAEFRTMMLRYNLLPEEVFEPELVADPIAYRGGELRYTPAVDDRQMLPLMLECAETIADDHVTTVRQQADLVAQLHARYADAINRLHEQKLQAIEQLNRRHAAEVSGLSEKLQSSEQRATDLWLDGVALRGSLTWRLRAAALAPARWLKQRLKQRPQPRAEEATPAAVVPAKIVVPTLEIHVAHGCNLTCESCSHYSNQGHTGLLTLDVADHSMSAWSGRLAPKFFNLIGGEPSLNTKLTALVRLAKRHWPDSQLRIISNGFFLHRHPDLPLALRETGTILAISKHHDSQEYTEKFEAITALIDDWKSRHGIHAEIWAADGRWTRRYHGEGKAMRPFEDAQPRQSWTICPARHSLQIHQGKLWKCPALAYLGLQDERFGLDEKWNKYLRYVPLAADCSSEALAEFVGREDESVCDMCPATPQPFELPSPLIPLGRKRLERASPVAKPKAA